MRRAHADADGVHVDGANSVDAAGANGVDAVGANGADTFVVIFLYLYLV